MGSKPNRVLVVAAFRVDTAVSVVAMAVGVEAIVGLHPGSNPTPAEAQPIQVAEVLVDTAAMAGVDNRD